MHLTSSDSGPSVVIRLPPDSERSLARSHGIRDRPNGLCRSRSTPMTLQPRRPLLISLQIHNHLAGRVVDGDPRQ